MTTYLPVHVAQDLLLVDSGLVQEILGQRAFERVPRADALIPGVFNWNGRAVPLLDLAPALGISEPPDAQRAHKRSRARVVVVRVGDELVGLSVDAAREVVRLSDEHLKPVQVSRLSHARAETELDKSLATVIDIPGLVGDLIHASLAEER